MNTNNTDIATKSDLWDVEQRIDERFEEVQSRILESEQRINKRLTEVIDLIIIQFGSKLQDHEQRISKLEKLQAA